MLSCWNRFFSVRFICRCFAALCALLLVFYVIIWFYRSNLDEQSQELPIDVNEKKIIVFWNTIFGKRLNEDLLNECDSQLKGKCLLTSKREFIDVASAVIFHIEGSDFSLTDLPKKRNPDQHYAFLTMEVPPSHNRQFISSIPDNFFNWSMTYRRDSDVPMPYGGWWVDPEKTKRLGLTPVNLVTDSAKIMEDKKQAIFWLVSNCHTASKRELAVEHLSSHIPVDILGQCSKADGKIIICERDAPCEERLAKEHYFYLALENTVCKDYITEKYWNRYSFPSVPIVMRRYVYEKLLPPKSFIAMDDFKSPEDMASYLKFLMSNETAYLSYFAWRAAGWSHPWQTKGYRLGYCKICEKLLEDNSPKIIKNIGQWFYETAECEEDQFATSWT